MLQLLERGDAHPVPCLRMRETGAGRDGEVSIRLRALAKPREGILDLELGHGREVSPPMRSLERTGSDFGGVPLGNGRACE